MITGIGYGGYYFFFHEEPVTYGITTSQITRSGIVSTVTAAERRKLLISGGSDYHGTNKNIPLGRLNAGRLTILKHIQGA